MEIEIMQQIISMVGGATESAVTIAILWIVGGYLVSLIGWGVFLYLVKFIATTIYKYLTVEVKKDEHLITLDQLSKARSTIELNNNRHTSERDIMKSEHKIEIEKIKHLYKILKESKQDV